MRAAMALLGGRGVMSLLLEGGPSVQQAAWDAGMIDRVMLFVSPTALGADGVRLLPRLSHFASFALERRRAEPCGDDVLIAGDVHRIDLNRRSCAQPLPDARRLSPRRRHTVGGRGVAR